MYRLIGAMAESALRSSVRWPSSFGASSSRQSRRTSASSSVGGRSATNQYPSRPDLRSTGCARAMTLHRHGGLELWVTIAWKAPIWKKRLNKPWSVGVHKMPAVLIGLCISNKSTESRRDTMGRMERLLSQATLSKSGRRGCCTMGPIVATPRSIGLGPSANQRGR